MRLTLSPVTGRRPDYIFFSVDIGVTDVTRNSRLLNFAVASTACSTLLKELIVVTAVFSPPIDIKQALQSSAPSQCPCRFVILATKEALYSHKFRNRHINILRSRPPRRTCSAYRPTSQPFSARNCRREN